MMAEPLVRGEELAYVVSHDVQEPLRVVCGYLDLLRDERLPEPAALYAREAAEAASRVQRLLDGILEYARVVGPAAAPTVCDAERALDDALANLERAVDATGARIERGSLPRVRADPAQLTQVLQNLVSNALKFQGGDAPRVRVHAERDGRMWRFCVADNGIGIDPAQRHRLFILFHRAHGDAYPGTGIGLAVCRRIVERHGGRIWADAIPELGATFYFTLEGR